MWQAFHVIVRFYVVASDIQTVIGVLRLAQSLNDLIIICITWVMCKAYESEEDSHAGTVVALWRAGRENLTQLLIRLFELFRAKSCAFLRHLSRHIWSRLKWNIQWVLYVDIRSLWSAAIRNCLNANLYSVILILWNVGDQVCIY